MWYEESLFYQIYPFGFCDAPKENDNICKSRILKISEWIPHMKQLGVSALYLCPVFSSDAHGYDTRDYRVIDPRLGSNEDFETLCMSLHKENIKIVLDGVFNHVGRGFWAFHDVQEKRHLSAYKDWFCLDFNRNNDYNDGFWYEGWEGHFNLVKLNLKNPEVVNHISECIQFWINKFDIDGIRLDVAYLLDVDFLRHINKLCSTIKSDFFLLGEMIHGDYNLIVNDEMLDSCTNYECYKGIYSSFNDCNMFEIAYSLNRQFGEGGLYKGFHLFNFVDNHDVTRLAEILLNKKNIEAAYALLFGMPGIPCIYYGSEWGAEGRKDSGSDSALRPCFEKPVTNDLVNWICQLSKIRNENPALIYGSYKQLYLTNLQLVFLREWQENKIIVAINTDSKPHSLSVPLTGKIENLNDSGSACTDSIILEPNCAVFFKFI